MTISYPVEPAKEFLTAALGADGYQALSRAAQRLPSLQAVYVPRAAIAWLQVAQRVGYEGPVPGTHASLEKGNLVSAGGCFSLASDFLRASSALVVDLLDEVRIPEDLDPRQVARLGKSVDALTRARFLSRLRELEISSGGASESTSASDHGSEETSTAESSAADLLAADTEPDDESDDSLEKASYWRSSEGLRIPKGGTAERQAWDDQYKQKIADRYAGGDIKKLKPVKVPVKESAYGHFVPDKATNMARNRVPLYSRMLAAGDAVPPVFVQRLGNNVFRILDGNARLKAALQSGKVKELPGYELEKGIEEPGQAAKPRGPLKPDAPDAPPGPRIGVAPVPMKPVSRARGFYKSELTATCGRCGQSQMRGRQVVGCLCLCDRLGAGHVVQKNEGDRIVLVGPDEIILAVEDVLGLPPG